MYIHFGAMRALKRHVSLCSVFKFLRVHYSSIRVIRTFNDVTINWSGRKYRKLGLTYIGSITYAIHYT